MKNHEPLAVICHLRQPIILSYPMPLDGIVQSEIITNSEWREESRHRRFWRRCVQDRGEAGARAYFEKRGFDIPEDDGHFSPFAVFGHGHGHGLWVYASSYAQIENEQRGSVFFTKRLNVSQILDWVTIREGMRLETNKGEFKSEYITLETTVTDCLQWYVCADAERLEEILHGIYGIGKKRRRGYGDVSGWDVQPASGDYSIFNEDGHLMRAVPGKLLDHLEITGDFAYQYTTYRPPYHSPRYAARCAVSGRRVE